ncbi:uncharacterized protein LOC123310601 isoform X2 [Coccinella septempunctata]|uniref:uncharacterized protein LOC123310601 isoform X2 n=1 Tax=Coccinella septempunctata TaxID=41139 RepID=UPI001D0962E3|nr:uncharacterized protein LOC123310601 isoform X2 [Coccinella septempunctata]
MDLIRSNMWYFAKLVFIACLLGYVTSLTCLSCTSKKNCENAPVTACTPEKKYCLTLSGQGTYFRGCYDNTMDCNVKDSNGNIAFPVCYLCQTDNCNTQDLN